MFFSMIWISIGFYFSRRKHRDTMRSFCNSIAFTKTFLSTTNIFLFLIPSFVVSKFGVFNSRNINFYFYENFLNFFCIKIGFHFSQNPYFLLKNFCFSPILLIIIPKISAYAFNWSISTPGKMI